MEQTNSTINVISGFPHDELVMLAKKYGTPLFVIDEYILRSNVERLKNAYEDYSGTTCIAYSVKANFNPSILRILCSEEILFDITTVEELFFYLKSGGSSQRVIYASITEELDEYIQILQKGVDRVVIGSCNGLRNIFEATKRVGTSPKIMVRINPDVNVKAEISASSGNGKFGVSFNKNGPDNALNLMNALLSNSELIFDGFHFHLGSQITDPSCFITALEKLEQFVLIMKKNFPELKINNVDIGGGTPVNYDVQVPTPEYMASVIIKGINNFVKNTGEQPNLVVESGRYISAESGLLVTRVVNSKTNGIHKTIIVDSGYHILLDSALLNHKYPQQILPVSESSDGYDFTLAGRLCDSLDIFQISSVSDLNGSDIGKFIVFKNVGAYSLVFHMPFHCQTKPPLLMRMINGDYRMIRNRETIEDLYEEEGGLIF